MMQLYRHVKLAGTPQAKYRIKQMKRKDHSLLWFLIILFGILLGLGH